MHYGTKPGEGLLDFANPKVPRIFSCIWVMRARMTRGRVELDTAL